MDQSKKYDKTLKLIVIGNSGVGKSNLLCRYVTGSFDTDHDMTIGVEFFTKNIQHNGLLYKVNIWDTAGEEAFNSITRIYYRGCAGCVVVYDVTCVDSFNNVERWIMEARNNTTDRLVMVLVANKCDLVDRRKVSTREGMDMAKRLSVQYIETSAFTGDHVADPFMIIMAQLDERDDKSTQPLVLDMLTDPMPSNNIGEAGWRCVVL